MASFQGLAPLAMNLNPYGVNEEVLAPCIRPQIGMLFTSHSLTDHHRADGRAGDPVRRPLENRERFPQSRRTVVQRPDQENWHAPPSSVPLPVGRGERQIPRRDPRASVWQK
jgi:hypothetical protein